MDTLYSNKTRRIASAYGLQPEELAFADLCACGWTREDAFFTAMKVGDTWSKDAVDKAIKALVAHIGVKKRIKEMRNPDEPRTQVEEPRNENILDTISKEAMLRDLANARKSMKFGSKEWLDTNKMIADITRMKQEEVKTEDNTIHYFLPLTCCKCELFQKAKSEKRK